MEAKRVRERRVERPTVTVVAPEVCPLADDWFDWTFFSVVEMKNDPQIDPRELRPVMELPLVWTPGPGDPSVGSVRPTHLVGRRHQHAEFEVDGIRVHVDRVFGGRVGGPGYSIRVVQIYVDGVMAVPRAFVAGMLCGNGGRTPAAAILPNGLVVEAEVLGGVTRISRRIERTRSR